MLTPDWSLHLHRNFRFIAEYEIFSREELVEIARGIQAVVDDQPESPITSVYESSIWGIAEAYLSYTQSIQRIISDSDRSYIRSRRGILGTYYQDNDQLTVVSYRDLLDVFDPGFSYWLGVGHFGPPAA